MRYRENFYVGEHLTGTEILEEGCTLELAKRHAKRAVEHGRADRVQICKITGQMVYQYPRKNAPKA